MTDGIRTGLSVEDIKQAFANNLYCVQGKFPGYATRNDYYMALAYTLRDRIIQRWASTVQTFIEQDVRVVSYLSAEFLVGPHLGNNLVNLGVEKEVREAMEASGHDLNDLIGQEEEPGLGNGGLGRLAACFMESLATLQVPALGYGIRYEYGIFDQAFRDGWQVERTDKWLALGNPWEIARPELKHPVMLGGRTEIYTDENGHQRVRWVPDRLLIGTAFDTPIVGYGVNTVNTLRLWKAEACESFDFDAFNIGDYYGAVDHKIRSENLTKVLYPNDEPEVGKRLRLQQQYFFVTCALQDMLKIHINTGGNVRGFHEKFAVQLNDTHPSIAVAELMRLLLDEHHLAWDEAWDITHQTFAYTNHTLLPEALETWSEMMFAEELPRHLEIIREIDARFCNELRAKYPQDEARVARMSLISHEGEHVVRMAHLATVGSHAVNGVAELHSELQKKTILKDFYELTPDKFTNVTNGVTPRRFVRLSNPELSALISAEIGDGWISDLPALRKLEPLAEDEDFQHRWMEAKFEKKLQLGSIINRTTETVVDPYSLFDVQIKRMHEYKRQHLNALHILHLYNLIKADPSIDLTPRTFIFAGKAAPGYMMAKLIIKLVTSIGDLVNNDPQVDGRLKVVFLPDYNVKHAQNIYPAADLSEQISTAGKEASGTGNMKFSLNGALTIGTLDGANIEIREEVGAENFFLFGLTAEEVMSLKSQGYDPRRYCEENDNLKAVMELLLSDTLSKGDSGLFQPLADSLFEHDQYMLFADFQSYADCQAKVGTEFKDTSGWARKSILNAARMGKFSSDRSIQEYCERIWKIKPVHIELRSI